MDPTNLTDPSSFSNLPHFAFIGAAAAMVGAFWGHIRGGLQSLSRIFVLEISLQSEAAQAATCYLNNNGRRFTLGTRGYVSFVEYVNTTSRRQTVAVEAFDSGDTFYVLGKVPLMLKHGSKLLALRGTVDPDVFVTTAINFFNEMKLRANRVTSKGQSSRFRVHRKHGRGSIHARTSISNSHRETDNPMGEGISSNSELFEGTILGIYRLLGIEIEHLGGLAGKLPLLDVLTFPKEVDSVLEEIEVWLRAEDWFRSRSIPWRMGTLFLGPPGTGKTTLVTGIAQRHDMPIFSLDISTMSNEEFEDAFASAAGHTPSIVLIEDIDRVFHGDENIIGDMGGGLTLDSILNTVAGAKPADGVLTMITANHPEQVSAAIAQIEDGKVSRPGRVDRIVTLGVMDKGQRVRCADRILDFKPTHIRAEIVKLGIGDTAAQFTDRCVTVAREAIKQDPSILAPIVLPEKDSVDA